MNNNFVWSILVQKKVLTEAEAVALSEALPKVIHPTDIKTAHKIIKPILEEVKENG